MSLRRLLLFFLVALIIIGNSGASVLAVEEPEMPEIHNSFQESNSEYRLGTPEEDFDMAEVPSYESTVTENVYKVEALAVEEIEFVIYPGENVQFINPTSYSRTVGTDAKTNDTVFDFASYDSEGEPTTSDLASNYANVNIPPNGGRSVITATDAPLTVDIKIDIEYSFVSTPALNKEVLSNGESYQFINYSNSTLYIKTDASSSNGKRYDFSIYDSDGSLYRSSMDNSSVSVSFSKGYEIIVTCMSDIPITVGTHYDVAFGEETDEPAYDSVVLNQGESYRFENVGDKLDGIEDDGGTSDKFDYVVYLSDGTESSRGTNTSSLPNVAVGRTVVITLITANPVRIGAPYRSFMGSYYGGDAISRITISPGSSYIFENNGSLSNPVKNNARVVDGIYDYTVYKADGSYYSQGFNSISTPSLPTGGFAVITVHGSSSVTFDYTDDFSVKVSTEPSHFRVTLSKGESFEFTNISPSSRFLYCNASEDSRFDWVKYYPDGTEHSKREGSMTNQNIPSGSKIIVTAVSDSPVTFGAIYRLFSWRDKPGEAFSKQVVNVNESFIFSNLSTKSGTITNNADEIDGKFDFVVYKEDGSVDDSGFDETSSVSIPSMGYAIVTGQSSSAVTFSYTDSFTAESANHPAMLRVTLNGGETYTYTNISSETESIYVDSVDDVNEFAYVLYKPNGTIHQESDNRNYTVPVPASYSLQISPLDLPVTFGGVYTSFVGTSGENPAIKKVTLYKNESYTFTNVQSSFQTLNSDAYSEDLAMFDYAIYSSNGEVEEFGLDQIGNLSVPEGSQVVVTVVTDLPVTFTYGLAFQAIHSSDPALLKRTLESSQSLGFKNKGTFEAKLKTNANTSENRYFNYTILDQNGGIVRQGENATISYNIPAGGTIQVKTTSANPVIFFAPYRVFEVVDVQEFLFENLLHYQALTVSKEAGQNGYYRFTAPETGRYRFVTKELFDFSLQPILELYGQQDLLSLLVSSEDGEQEFGIDYTVLEFDLIGGATYYLKLTEKTGLPLEVQLMAAVMTITPEANFDYSPDGRLNQINFPSGDALIYEYDKNGNLKRRTKKVYPF
ncbi:hypothetical protein V3851_03110 [Paenibacillus sp. M1]|uniref:YD repeat-containing protein n=1 Tax=Paenibacillus haidiansis TaxID=1574488 RepID=A0ABU7VM52_9BACL